ncbi:MAG: TonB-dependent receptor domain-containing protein [Flavicella sp.]
MISSLKKILFVVSIAMSNLLFAQNTTVTGLVLDKKNNTPIPFATLVVKSATTSIGSSSTIDGQFTFEGLPSDTYSLTVSYIGFAPSTTKFTLSSATTLELPVLYLSETSQKLEEVSITGVNKTQQTSIDRKTYTTNDFATAKGGNAVDVLSKLPAVNVTANGTISVRGSQDFMVYINGKPTTIDPSVVLTQIPSTSIQKIDVITVPSARYDAQGKGGIVNITTKKRAVLGFSGNFNGSIGGASWANFTDKYSNHTLRDDRYIGNIQLNYVTEKFNGYAGFSYNEKHVNGKRTGEARVLTDAATGNYFHMNAKDGARPEWYNYYSANAGIDFDLSDTQKLAFSYFYGNRNNGRAAYYNYETFKAPVNFTVKDDLKYIYNPNKDNRYGVYHTLTGDYTVNFSNNSVLNLSSTYESSDLSRSLSNSNYFYDSREAIDSDIPFSNKGDDAENTYTMSDNTPLKGLRFAADYSSVLTNGATIESGLHFQHININGDFNYDNEMIESGTVELDNAIDFDRAVTAAYIDYSKDSGSWSTQFGLRTEYATQETSIENTSYLTDFGLNEASDYSQEKLDLFPSFHVQFDKSDYSKFITAASRRVNRPSLTKLSPFLYRRHFEVYVIGDPTLKPEYLNNFEFTYDTTLGKQNLTFTAFYRGIENSVFRVNTITTLEQNPSMYALLKEDVLIRSYTNAGNSQAVGGEFTANLFVNKFAKFLFGASLYNYQIKGDVFGYDVDQNSTNWNIKSTANFTLTSASKLSLDYNYTSATVTSQGQNDPFESMNIAYSYTPSSLKGWSFNARLLDLLQTNVQGLDTNAYNSNGDQIFYQETAYERNGPIFELGIRYTFNSQGKKVKKIKGSQADKHFK